MDVVRINQDVTIRMSEISFTFSTGGGPGGQHVNKTATKVILRFDVDGSPSLSAQQRARLRERLGARLDREGVLQIQVQDTRSQHQNRALAVDRLRAVLAEALRPRRPRRPTKPTRSSKERRLEAKRRRSDTKRRRRYRPRFDD